jgi:hypothetical protein
MSGSPVFETEQIFNRRSLGYLWDRKHDLDPGQVAIITSIYNNKKKEGALKYAAQKITYKLSRSAAGKLGYGRLYGSKGSFETLEKECRGTICKEYYHDIDIVNCHPVLLLQLANAKGKTLLEIHNYVEDREIYLNHLMSQDNISRDQAKECFIKIMYGGHCNKDSPLYNLSREVKKFTKELFEEQEYKDLADVCKGGDNVYGTFLSLILQTEERKCMLAMREYFKSEKWSVDVFCYDGVMIRKREGVDCNLPLCAKYIKDKTGYDINLVTKEMLSFDVPVATEEIVPGVTKEEYLEMKRDFESSNFYHAESDRFVTVKEDSTLIFMTLSHAHELLNRSWNFKKSEKHADYIPFLDIWRKDPTAKICDSISFRESDKSNVFLVPLKLKYMKTEPYIPNENAIPKFLELISLVTCDDDILKEYVLNYFAHMIQHPTDLPGVALVITGLKGVGKDTLGDFLQEWVVGKHLSTNYSNNKQFFGTHDMGKINKLLVKLEETSRKDCMENACELKATITSYLVTANPKGMKEITAENFARYIFTTNKPNPVDMSDKERRFVLLRCSDKQRGNSDYWITLRSILFNYSGGRAIAEFLLGRDLTKFNVRDLPENVFQKSIIASEETTEQKFIQQWKGEKVQANQLFDMFRTFCIDNSLSGPTNTSWFGKNMQTFVRDGVIINTFIHHSSYYHKPGME